MVPYLDFDNARFPVRGGLLQRGVEAGRVQVAEHGQVAILFKKDTGSS